MKLNVSCAVIGLFLLSALVWVVPGYRSTIQSVSLWGRFQSALVAKDQETIRNLLSDTTQDLHEINGADVFYFGQKYTDQLTRKQVSFSKTLEFYLTDKERRKHDKVVFRRGYALIDDGRIMFLKFP